MSLKICDRCEGRRFRAPTSIGEYEQGPIECDTCKGLGVIEVEDSVSPEELNQIYKAKDAQGRQLHACDKKKQAHMKMCRFNTAETNDSNRGNKGQCMIDNNRDCIGQCLHDRNKIVKGVDQEWILMR